MMMNVNMFSARVLDWIFRDVDGTCFIIEKGESDWLSMYLDAIISLPLNLCYLCTQTSKSTPVMLLARFHISLFIAHFEYICSLNSWSHSIHILEINFCRDFCISDQFSLWISNIVSYAFLEQLTYSGISWVMLSLLTIHHLFSLPRFLPHFFEVQALRKSYLRGTN